MVPITDDTFKYICLNENDCILTRTLLKFVTTTRVQIMISQHWSRQWHGTEQATCHFLNRRCPRMTDACMRRSVEMYNRRINDLCTQICCNNGA